MLYIKNQKNAGPDKGLRATEYGLVRGSVAFVLIFCFFWIKPDGEALLSTTKNKQLRKTKATAAAVEEQVTALQVYAVKSGIATLRSQ